MKKVKYIALVLILALGLMGGAYAAWSNNLHVDGTVATGDIDVVFTSATSNDPGETLDPGGPADDMKNVGNTEVAIIDGGKKLEVTIGNAYPGYVSEIDYAVTNNGTVPVKLQSKSFNVNADNPAGLVVENGCCMYCLMKSLGMECLANLLGLTCTCPTSPEPPLLEVGSQIHKGDTYAGTISDQVRKVV